MLPKQEKVYSRRKWPAGSSKTSICHRGSWFILWLMGDDTSIHIQMDACWKLKTLIITVKQFMASNCMFTVHRVLSHSSWRDFPVAFEIKGDGEGWRGVCVHRAQHVVAHPLERLTLYGLERHTYTVVFHYVMQLPCHLGHLPKSNLTPSISVFNYPTCYKQNRRDGRPIVQGLCRWQTVVELFFFPSKSLHLL